MRGEHVLHALKSSTLRVLQGKIRHHALPKSLTCAFMPTPEQSLEPIPEQPVGESQRIADDREAVEAAYGEKPARDFIVAHKTELTAEQQYALDWFATAEGEKALASFQQMKTEQQNAVRQKAWAVLDTTKMGGVRYRTSSSIIPSSDEFLSRVNNLLQPALRSTVAEILSKPLQLSEKMKEIGNSWSGIVRGIRGYSDNVERNFKPDNMGYLGGSPVAYKGVVSAAFVDQNFPSLVEMFKILDQYTFADCVKQFSESFSQSHTDQKFDDLMNSKNYIFSSKSSQYEKVEA